MHLSGIVFVVVACIAPSLHARNPAARRGRPAAPPAASASVDRPGAPAGRSIAAPGRSIAVPGRALPKPGGPEATAPVVPANPTIDNPCAPMSCYKFQKLNTFEVPAKTTFPHQTYDEWRIDEGRWLKVKTVPFNSSSDEYQFYTAIGNSGLPPTVPALVVINLGGSLSIYKERMKTLETQISTEAGKLVTGLRRLVSGQGKTPSASEPQTQQLQARVTGMRSAYATAYKKLSEEAKQLRETFHKKWTVTVYNYLGGEYQPSQATPDPTLPDLTGKPDLSTVTVPAFNVYTTYYSAFGFGPALEYTSHLASFVNQTIVDKVYFLNYLNGRYDIWLPVNSAVNPFP